jgi:hypothetical protein
MPACSKTKWGRANCVVATCKMMNIKGGRMVEQNVFVVMHVPPLPTFRDLRVGGNQPFTWHRSNDSWARPAQLWHSFSGHVEHFSLKVDRLSWKVRLFIPWIDGSLRDLLDEDSIWKINSKLKCISGVKIRSNRMHSLFRYLHHNKQQPETLQSNK